MIINNSGAVTQGTTQVNDEASKQQHSPYFINNSQQAQQQPSQRYSEPPLSSSLQFMPAP